MISVSLLHFHALLIDCLGFQTVVNQNKCGSGAGMVSQWSFCGWIRGHPYTNFVTALHIKFNRDHSGYRGNGPHDNHSICNVLAKTD
jgi:hypothetical protein